MPTFKQNPKDKALDDVYCPGQNAQSGDPKDKENVPEQNEAADKQENTANQDSTKDNTCTVNTENETCSINPSKDSANCNCEEKSSETEKETTEAPEKVLKANFVPGPIVEDEIEKTTGNEATATDGKSNLRGRSTPKTKLATGGSVQKIGELSDDEMIEEHLSGKAVSPKRAPRERTEPEGEPKPRRVQPTPVSSENKPKFTSEKRRQRELNGEDLSKPIKRTESKESQSKHPQRKKNEEKKVQEPSKTQKGKASKEKGFFAKIVDAIASIFAGPSQQEEKKTGNNSHGKERRQHHNSGGNNRRRRSGGGKGGNHRGGNNRYRPRNSDNKDN